MGDTEMRREEQGVERAEKDSAAAAAAQVAAAQVAAAQVAAAQVAANMYCHCRVVLTRGSHTRLSHEAPAYFANLKIPKSD
jgi:hypothetical protein